MVTNFTAEIITTLKNLLDKNKYDLDNQNQIYCLWRRKKK